MYECLDYSICKDETRGMLFETIQHNSKIEALVSCDGCTATFLKFGYDKELADKSINVKTYKTNKREFPNVSVFDINNAKIKHTLKIEFKKEHYIKSKKANVTKLHINNDNSLSFDVSEKRLASINAEYIKPLIGHTLNVHILGELAPIYIELYTKENYYVIMPIRL